MENPSEADACHKRFQAAVDVIQNLPKNGSYRPSYEVMLRFYGLYKQAVCGPCTVSRPGFWDPVGRYKWDAWSQLGDMSQESAMSAYVDEMKKVAQEVIDNMPINEKTASFYHYFEPLYHVIDDMPRPPEALLNLTSDVNANEQTTSPAAEVEPGQETEQQLRQEIATELVLNRDPQSESSDPRLAFCVCADPALAEALVLTSDSESEVFCDSVEQLDIIKTSGGVRRNGHALQAQDYTPTQMGAGQGGEGAGNGQGPPLRRREPGGEGMRHGSREPPGGIPHHSSRRAEQLASGGRGGGDFPQEAERLQDLHVHQQIVLALRKLQKDMHSVRERLEVVEGLAAANAQNSQWRSHMQLRAQNEEEKWWPFDVSGPTLLLLLVWPFVAQGMLFLLKRRKKKPHLSIL